MCNYLQNYWYSDIFTLRLITIATQVVHDITLLLRKHIRFHLCRRINDNIECDHGGSRNMEYYIHVMHGSRNQ